MTSIGIGFDDGTGLAIVAVRPAGASNQAEERVAAALTRLGDTEPPRVERALLSTEYGADGEPRRASIELHLLDEVELPPLRVGGERLEGGSVLSLGPAKLQVVPFRWSLESVDGLGSYQLLIP